MNMIPGRVGGVPGVGGGWTGFDTGSRVLDGVLNLVYLCVGIPLTFLVIGAALFSLLSAASLLLSTAAVFLGSIFGDAQPGVFQTIVLSAIAGVFAGVAAVWARSLGRLSGTYSKSFLSALFSKDLAAPEFDATMFGRMAIGGLVGGSVGAVMGASGGVSFAHFFTDTIPTVLHDPSFPIATILAGGSSGAGGGADSWFVLFVIVMALVIVSVVYGMVGGFGVHLLIGVAGASTKAASKAFIERMLTEGRHEESIVGPMVAGIRRGAFVGLLSGVIQALFTVWGIIKFYKPGG